MKEISREEYVKRCKGLCDRPQVGKIKEFINGVDGCFGNVLVLYGPQNTGKTTMFARVLAGYPPERCAFLEAEKGDRFEELRMAIDMAEKRGADIIAMDKVTLAKDFVQGAEFLRGKHGTSLLLTGDECLGFELSSRRRCTESEDWWVYSEYVPFAEHIRMTGDADFRRYVRYGGLVGGKLGTMDDAGRYLDDVIDGIRHILKYSGDSGRLYQTGAQLCDGNIGEVIRRLVGMFGGEPVTQFGDWYPYRQWTREEGYALSKVWETFYDGIGRALSPHLTRDTVSNLISTLIYAGIFSEMRRLVFDDRMWAVEQEYHFLLPAMRYLYAAAEYTEGTPEKSALKWLYGTAVQTDMEHSLRQKKYLLYRVIVRLDRRFQRRYDETYDIAVFDQEQDIYWLFGIDRKPKVLQDLPESAPKLQGTCAGTAVLYTKEAPVFPTSVPYLNVAEFLISLDRTGDIAETMEELTKNLQERNVMKFQSE